MIGLDNYGQVVWYLQETKHRLKEIYNKDWQKVLHLKHVFSVT